MNKYKYVNCTLCSDRKLERCGYRKRNPAMSWMNKQAKYVSKSFIQVFIKYFSHHIFNTKEYMFTRWFSTVGSKLPGKYKTTLPAYLGQRSTGWSIIYDCLPNIDLQQIKREPDEHSLGYIDYPWGTKYITYSDLSKEDQFIYDVYAELCAIPKHVCKLIPSNLVRCLSNKYIYKDPPKISELGSYSLYIGNIPKSLNRFIETIEFPYFCQITNEALYLRFTEIVKDGEDIPLNNKEDIDAINNTLESYENLRLLGVI